MVIKFGPAGLGPVKSALQVLEQYAKLGLKACEIAFTYSVYIKPEDAKIIGAKAKELGIDLSIHAQYFVNLASTEKAKQEATKKRILDCCKIGELLGVKVVVFHPGYYINKGKTEKDKQDTYNLIKKGIEEIMKVVKANGWKIQIAPETMGKVNVFGSIEEISSLVKETGCAFCIDFAHILARDKKIDYAKVISLFPGKEWHVHFSGIVYGELGEKHHIPTPTAGWKELLKHLPKDKEIRIINESPEMVEDAVKGLKLYN
ncbi:MAG: TIM barrel protein [archaeon]